MEGCALLLHYLSWSNTLDLISIVSPTILKWAPIPQFKSLKSVQRVFSGAAKQVIIELTPIINEKHLLVGLVGDKVVALKKRPKKRPSRAVEEVDKGENTKWSFKFDDVFDVDFPAPSPKEHKKKLSQVPKFQGLQPCLRQ